MNERIRELYLQASVDDSVDSEETMVEKFAELIVRECINVIGEENYTMLTGKAYCTELKRHFGVRE